MSIYTLALLIFLGQFSSTTFAATYPEFTGEVVDQAQILSRSTRAELIGELRAHRRDYGDQVVVATVPDLGGVNIAQYSLGLARQWRLGNEGSDNGVLILVAPSERQVRIEVGYGLESTLTDGAVNSIIKNDITPQFKLGNFDAGTESGARAVLDALRNPGAAGARNGSDNRWTMAVPLLFAGFFALTHFFKRKVSQRAVHLVVMSGAAAIIANAISKQWFVGIAVGLVAALFLYKKGNAASRSGAAGSGAFPHPRPRPEDPPTAQDFERQSKSRYRDSNPNEGGGGFGGGGASGSW